MAVNEFAAKLHKHTHKIVVVLVYALLEWVLIMLLLFNSVFYYSIRKFASFFGLKPTCLWCSSVDSLFEPGKKDNSYEGLFCEDHTCLISKLGHCSTHKKLVEIQRRCQECSIGVDLVPLMKHDASEDGVEKDISCSCCEKSLRCDLNHLMINGSLDVVPKESLRIEEIEEEDNNGNNMSNEEPQILSDAVSFYLQEAGSRSTSTSVCNEDEEDTCDDGVDAKAEEAINSSVDHSAVVGKFQDESGTKEFMDLNCVLLKDVVGGEVVAELEEEEIKSAELEKEVVGVTETPVNEEGILVGNETSVNEALDDHPDEKHNEEARSILDDNGDNEKQSHLEIEQGKIDESFDPALVIQQLRTELECERGARKELSAELDAERSAASIAANQTMAMITRLQEEKAAIKMEAVQYQRMMEEQAEYDQEALQLLNELVIKREKEKQELEKELEVYQEKVLDYEVNKEKEMSLRKCGHSPSSSCSLNDDSEKLSIDLNKEVTPSTGAVLESVDMVLDRVKNWNMLDGSLEEFEQERLSILHQLKELEVKLFSICDDDDQEEQLLFEDVKPIEHLLEKSNEVKDENANLCSAEVNLAPVGCLAELTKQKDHPTTMASAAKKLLPFLESEDGETEQAGLDTNKIELDQKGMEVETSDKVLAIMKEMDHVYGRLQALEADREFLRHCIGSLNKGDKGVGLLEEILQHLRELRSTDTCELMICHE